MINYTRSLRIAILIALTASAAAQDKPKEAKLQAPPVIKPILLCEPVEVGGTGTNYLVSKNSKGSLFTWYCDETPVSITAPTSNKAEIYDDPKKMSTELKRLAVMASYANDPYLMKKEVEIQLKKTAPKK